MRSLASYLTPQLNCALVARPYLAPMRAVLRVALSMAAKATEKTVPLTHLTHLLRSMNDDIADIAADFERGDPAPLLWGFACECGNRGCAEWVQRDLAGYHAMRAEPDSVLLAEGHTLVSSAQATRHLAGELREAARALRGEARQQQARARRLQVTRDYRYELRQGETTLATGHLREVEPLEVGDRVDVGGVGGTVVAVEPVVGDHEQWLVVQRDEPLERHDRTRRKSSV